MNKSLLKYFSIVLIVSLLISSVVSMIILSGNMLDNTEKDMKYTVLLCDYQMDYTKDLQDQVRDINALAYEDDSRLTVISRDGEVLADSDKSSIKQNHKSREEVKEALASTYGYATRYSSTIHKNLLYVAYFNGDYIIRLAIPYGGILDNVASLIEPLFISTILSLIVSISLAFRFSKTITQPLNDINDEIVKMQGNQALSFDHYKYEEFNMITVKLKEQSDTIRQTMKELKLEKMKINNILDHMNEGFILLDNTDQILMVNKKIKDIYSDQIQTKRSIRDYIFDFKIIDALDHLGNQGEVVDVKKENMTYRCFISRVEYGVTLLFVDVTQEVNALKMRTEFFSNVSHELKTPMTSIRGYSELLQAGLIENPEEKKAALDTILTEVNNMSSLINDILMISRLENKDIEVISTPIYIHPIVDEILSSLQVEIDKKDIRVSVDIQDVAYQCNNQHMHQLLNNLIINGIKYNKEHGLLKISAYVEDQKYFIKVSDTGRGISILDQTRVFERFYRCDNGRDRDTGGTGLGLAIVKHIVQFYNGNIELESKIDQGSTFTISLPLSEN